MPTICLNMIVKNEELIIKRLLNSVLPIIDSYCICDTGSTDNTISIIQDFFKDNNINGKIIEKTFKDFGFNRNFALNECKSMENVDYILLLDADMILKLNKSLDIQNFKNSMSKDAYYILQGTQKMHYKNIRIIRNNLDFSYWGVTHEYINLPKDVIPYNISTSTLFINDIGDGGAKQDKFIRDIKLLKNGLIEHPNNDRYTFYLANSYKDSGMYEEAINTYLDRIKLGGWSQEVWYSYYQIGNSYKSLNIMSSAIFYWLEAYNYLPERIENLYEIVYYYRTNQKYKLADCFYNLALISSKSINPDNQLFFQRDIYDYKLDYEFSIIGFYSNTKNIDMLKLIVSILNYNYLESDITRNIFSNYKFYVNKLIDIALPHSTNLQLLNNNILTININTNGFYNSTPSICYGDNKIFINTRFVNYYIKNDGSYKCGPTIETKNVITIFNINDSVWEKEDEFELKYHGNYNCRYVGLEDIRLITHNKLLLFNSNRGIDNNKIAIESGYIDIKGQQTSSSVISYHCSQQVEKNWVLFINSNNLIKVIYKWYPLTIGDYTSREECKDNIIFEPTDIFKMPLLFKNVRGSTNGIIIGNEVWFITHIVSHEKMRYYYHLFVILDHKTYQLKKYSIPFTFEKNRIEYTLGFVYNNLTNTFIIGYSTNDNTTKYIELDKTKMENNYFIK